MKTLPGGLDNIVMDSDSIPVVMVMGNDPVTVLWVLKRQLESHRGDPLDCMTLAIKLNAQPTTLEDAEAKLLVEAIKANPRGYPPVLQAPALDWIGRIT